MILSWIARGPRKAMFKLAIDGLAPARKWESAGQNITSGVLKGAGLNGAPQL